MHALSLMLSCVAVELSSAPAPWVGADAVCLQVSVLFAGQHISKSPFEVNVDKAQGDASKVTAKGPGLEATGNIANKPTYFDLYTAGKQNKRGLKFCSVLRCEESLGLGGTNKL